MFGSNTTIPTSVKVAGIETHVMSTLVGQTGVAAQHSAPGNKHTSLGLSARMEASANAVSKAELEKVLADDFDPTQPKGHVEGAAMPGLTPAQLKMLKKNTPRAVSHPDVKPKYREGDPRSPEMRALKARAQKKNRTEVQGRFWEEESQVEGEEGEESERDDHQFPPNPGEEKKESGANLHVGFKEETPPDEYASENARQRLIIETSSSPMKEEIMSPSSSQGFLEHDEVPFEEFEEQVRT